MKLDELVKMQAELDKKQILVEIQTVEGLFEDTGLGIVFKKNCPKEYDERYDVTMANAYKRLLNEGLNAVDNLDRILRYSEKSKGPIIDAVYKHFEEQALDQLEKCLTESIKIPAPEKKLINQMYKAINIIKEYGVEKEE